MTAQEFLDALAKERDFGWSMPYGRMRDVHGCCPIEAVAGHCQGDLTRALIFVGEAPIPVDEFGMRWTNYAISAADGYTDDKDSGLRDGMRKALFG